MEMEICMINEKLVLAPILVIALFSGIYCFYM